MDWALELWLSGWAGRQLPGQGTTYQPLCAFCLWDHGKSSIAVCRLYRCFLARPMVFAHHRREQSLRPELNFQPIPDTFAYRPSTCFIMGSEAGCREPALSWSLLTWEGVLRSAGGQELRTVPSIHSKLIELPADTRQHPRTPQELILGGCSPVRDAGKAHPPIAPGSRAQE